MRFGSPNSADCLNNCLITEEIHMSENKPKTPDYAHATTDLINNAVAADMNDAGSPLSPKERLAAANELQRRTERERRGGRE
jgi:hypothetical protein